MSDKNAAQDSIERADDPTEWVVRKVKELSDTKSKRESDLQTVIGRLLPTGFPFVVDDISGAISELILFYLYEKHFKEKASVLVINKLVAYAFDCKDWLNFLDCFEIIWHQATLEDLERYVGVMNAVISPSSGEAYHNSTPRRRVSTIEGLYQWAREKVIYDGPLPKNALLWPIDGSSSNEEGTSRNKVTVSLTAEEDEPVHVMELEQARCIMKKLGPLPREVIVNRENVLFDSTDEAIRVMRLDVRSSRDRLAAEYGLNSGLRISEIRGMNCNLFNGYKTESVEPNKHYKFWVVGKGRKRRRVDVPGWLIQETLTYMECERSLIVSSVGIAANANALFLNPVITRQHAGKRVSVRTLERQFAKACVETGQCVLEERTSIKQRGSVVEEKTFYQETPLFVFHDLRHTYAVWTYYARKRAGDLEPWAYIQARLGHKHLTTTMNRYLKAAGDFEAAVSDAFMRHINEKY
ncbi:site-specific integrase [Burkholderia humptydooensis]|uniref:Site-specific integrase n=1 Tax=Burkholderia humptydooensis TaxID=430531 RepID=A0A7T2WYH8_9BURK|nr:MULTISPECIES: site-specific integrase [Burkholderia]AJY41867.1 phage integrase family protein [Burkholderia sp. 2002721687]QPS42845.1 site-specific integrase [Burkholderia humptydooensis]